MSTEILDRQPASETRPQGVSLVRRIQCEFNEMPGLTLTEAQAQILWNLDGDTCRLVLCTLLERRFLKRSADGIYVRAS